MQYITVKFFSGYGQWDDNIRHGHWRIHCKEDYLRLKIIFLSSNYLKTQNALLKYVESVIL